MKIHHLGTCSGTEPMQGMHHTSLVIETGDSLYWFDTGESCAHTAYTSGLEVMKTKAIFISHPHIDHTGGLANLLALFWKLVGAFKHRFVPDNSVRVYFPGLEVFEAIKSVTLGTVRKKSGLPFDIIEKEITDGLIFEDENIHVSALHNRHLGEDGTEGWHSYSFLIEAEGKRVVYSGDVATSSELAPLTADGCDCLIHETGHHKVSEVIDFAVSKGVKRLSFTHHGRAIINDRSAMKRLTEEANEKGVIQAVICHDGMIEEI